MARANRRMKTLLGKLVTAGATARTTANVRLKTHPSGAVLLDGVAETDPAEFEDLTGFECFVNHVHFRKPIDALATAEQIRRLLKESFRGDFEIIVAGDAAGYTVRFHKWRPREEWLSNDLEGYSSEAVLSLDTGDSKLEWVLPKASTRTAQLRSEAMT